MDHEKYMHMHGSKMSSMKKASFEVALKSKQQIAEGTWAFVFEKPTELRFKAGQHIRTTLINPSETDTEGNSRFLSVASTPQDDDLVVAMRMRDTAFKRVLGRMQIGEKVFIQILLGVPHGAFAIHDDSAKPAVFIACGIGIVPAYSMIKDTLERKLPHKLFLFYSNRRPEDAPFLNELQMLAKQNPCFKLIATMTAAEKSAQAWGGEIGKIDRTMLTKYLSDLQSPLYYLAGLPDMTSAMKTMLTDSGVSEDNIHAEEFTGFNLNEIQDAPAHSWKRHALIVAIALIIIVMVIVHISIATSIFSNAFSFENPVLYVLLGLLLVLFIFKFKHLSGFLHKKKP